jgi:hypothetical protein
VVTTPCARKESAWPITLNSYPSPPTEHRIKIGQRFGARVQEAYSKVNELFTVVGFVSVFAVLAAVQLWAAFKARS